MAEQYRTRRERREAERRAAEAARAAQESKEDHSADGSEDAPARPAVKPQTPVTGQGALAAEPTQAPTAAPTAPAAADPRPTEKMAPVTPAPAAPTAPQTPPPAAPSPARSEQTAQAGSATQPASAAAPKEDSAPAAAGDMPQFRSRAERRRYMREHGLEPRPVDADEAPRDSQAEGEVPAPAAAPKTEDKPQKPAAAPQKPAQSAGSRATTSAESKPAAADQQGASKGAPTAPAGPVVKPAEAQHQAPTSPAAPAASAAATAPASPAAPGASAADDAPKKDADAPKKDGADHTPQKAEKTAESDGRAEAEHKDSGDSGQTVDWVARRQAASKPRERRAPVVKPPKTQGITVVTGSGPAVDQQTDANRPAQAGGASAAQKSSFADYRSAASGPATMPIESVTISPEESQLLHADEGDEVENPPAGPMKARDVTYGDGEILVGDRPSAIPYIVLGAGGLVAIVLIIIALIMLF